MKMYLAVALATTSAIAQAVPLTVNISGTVSSIGGQAYNQVDEFAIGDHFAYQLNLDDSLLGPATGGAARNLNLVSDFRARIGGYRIEGDGADVFLRNDGSTGVFQDPYDQLSIDHLSAPVYAGGFGIPNRTDFTFTDGPIAGEAINSLSLLIQHPDVDFVQAGQNLTQIFQSVASSSTDLKVPVAANPRVPTFEVNALFMNEGFGEVPVSVEIAINSLSVNPTLAAQPLAFGTATAAIVKETRFGNATDAFDTSTDGSGGVDSRAFAFSTNAGQASARGNITDAVIEDSKLKSPGLEVGAFASGAGDSGQALSRAIAFRSFEYAGEDPLRINVNSTLDGRFRDAPFGLPSGQRSASGGIYVFDAVAFADAINWLGGDLEDIFFPLAGKNTDNVDPLKLDDLSIASLLGINPLAALSFNELATADEIMRDLVLSLNVASGQEFTILYDLSATSLVSCFVSECGAGSTNFFNSLSSAADFFTDEQGNVVTSIVPLALVDDGQAVPLPATWLLLVGGLLVTGMRKWSSDRLAA